MLCLCLFVQSDNNENGSSSFSMTKIYILLYIEMSTLVVEIDNLEQQLSNVWFIISSIGHMDSIQRCYLWQSFLQCSFLSAISPLLS